MGQVYKTRRGSAWHILLTLAGRANEANLVVALCGSDGKDAQIIDGVPTCKLCIREQARRDQEAREDA